MNTSTTLIQPYLFFGGRCEEALEFHRTAPGAEIEMVMMPLEKTFWSPRFGMVTDRFGIGWMVNVVPAA